MERALLDAKRQSPVWGAYASDAGLCGRNGLVGQSSADRSSATRAASSAATVRALAQSAFVDEDDGTPFFLGFFLISGQRRCFQRRILSSSRSSARPTGRWQLHPSCRRIRQACEGWYLTPHSCSIKWATRHEVHKLVSYPSASGPRFKPRSIRRQSSGRKGALR